MKKRIPRQTPLIALAYAGGIQNAARENLLAEVQVCGG
jgi:hypothetical protein